MTNQEIFDKVVKGVLDQGCQSKVGAVCRYRGTGGTKCAAGFLIPDEKYLCEFETRLADELQHRYPYAVEYTAEQVHLVRALQLAHDQAVNYDRNGVDTKDAFRTNFINMACVIAEVAGLSNLAATTWCEPANND
jgi:hypothetical protein